MTLVKVCGIRSVAEGRAALLAGANLLGFIFWKPGKRYISPADAARIIIQLRRESLDWSAVGVFVDPSPAEVAEAATCAGSTTCSCRATNQQTLVRAMPRPTLKAIHIRAGGESAASEVVATDTLGAHLYLLDTHSEAPARRHR